MSDDEHIDLGRPVAVLLMGVGVLFLLDSVREGTVDTMLREPLGQVALVVAGAVYGVGILVVMLRQG